MSATVAAATCLYMVHDLRRTHGMYLGDFLVLQRTGDRLDGYGGAFYGEGFAVRGSLSGRTARLATENPYSPGDWSEVTRTWVPDPGRLAGWRLVSRQKLATYAGGYLPKEGEVCD